MATVGRPQRRAILTGGLIATAAVITGCSSKSDAATASKTAAGDAAVKTSPSPSAGPRPDSARSAFARLMEGNKRWVAGTLQHPDIDPTRRKAVAQEQKPYGVIVSCIDSRVPPELVFDTGLGDLFVMRTGGHVVQPVVTGSIEYGPLTAGTPLIVVLGHQRCGAIKAAHEALKTGKKLPGTLQPIADALRPAYKETAKGKHADPVDAMIRIHSNRTAADLRSNAALAPLVKKGDLTVVSAYYSLDTGRVEVLNGAPKA
ncbi:carbonic anhydrase [Streptomyces ipomoeae]|jgi:carbonic anhydrase|uniref:Carbonate dehydratase n=2 Tax=Streptomyces ipomoeae TaxID=103232 RepID=L1L8H4_9ACTN|nr:carbonic anhydrase [Streptomyces ipomoeae]EKX69104.1 carbonate dehydratase [Streptomyces ipomoeae 91-03]MDX2692867.1 carbonic anhydrase [Streptomyces ipomoeae]MDX2820213.1 carbonic anhydrase [Streptomyces ipomoeae]MDX2841980.1 carbonic anhydrase [Streptomyces ipomoeae]MDX2874929.1 carbonic anhydrase [Streptomyces ipomoeae]